MSIDTSKTLNSKYEKLKETHTKTHHIQTLKDKRILKAAREKWLITQKEPQ